MSSDDSHAKELGIDNLIDLQRTMNIHAHTHEKDCSNATHSPKVNNVRMNTPTKLILRGGWGLSWPFNSILRQTESYRKTMFVTKFQMVPPMKLILSGLVLDLRLNEVRSESARKCSRTDLIIEFRMDVTGSRKSAR